MLKKKKGFNIVTKSLRCKLLREGFDFAETKTAFNEAVNFFFELVDMHPEGLDIPIKDNGGWRYYELLVIGDNPEYEFIYQGFPSPLRRAAIRKAIGVYSSWRSNLTRWRVRAKRYKHHRPPMKPRSFNFSPSFDVVHRGFAANKWQKLHKREVEFSRAVARELVEFAHHHQCSIMAFEHLSNLKLCKGKYSRRSNQKRAYWLKSRVFNQVKDLAYRDYSILTTRVNPRNTSRLDPWGNLVWRGNSFPVNLLDYLEYQPGANLVANTHGYKAHSGLNAARNIGLKAIGRHRTDLSFLRKGKPRVEML